MSSTNITISVTNALSPARMSTYETAARHLKNPNVDALSLYAWNVQVSGAFLAPLHICEVVIRNAISEVLEKVYGSNWPWSTTFEKSLPNSGGYCPKDDLCRARKKFSSTGKVIPELKFVFWQKMFTGRFDDRLWDKHLKDTFPNIMKNRTVPDIRISIYRDLETIRELRNRIAHHEPIFSRPLKSELNTIIDLIRGRCNITADWIFQNQSVLSAIEERPK